METKTGQIEAIEQKKAANGNPYTKYKISGLFYNYFGDPVNLAMGDNVEIYGEQKGKFFNVKSIKKTDSTTPQQKTQNQAPIQASEPSDNQSQDLLRQILSELKQLNSNLGNNGN